MKRATDAAKWDGSGFKPERVKRREPWGRRMDLREREFEKAPVETLLTMARVAGTPIAHISRITRRWRNRSYTRWLAIPLNDEHAAIWSPEAGIKVVPLRVVW
jgi:hypothetical protein